MIKRLNFLTYFNELEEYDKDKIETILFSLIEHRISDLGFNIETHTVDLKNYMYGKDQETVKIVSNVVKNLLLTVPANNKIELIPLDKYIFDIHITKEF